ASGRLRAQTPTWQPSPGLTQVPIWPGAAPDPHPVAGPETATTSGKDWLVAGRPAVSVTNVTRPTITVYSPNGKNTGAAVVVFPGGGYQILAMDLEGTGKSRYFAPHSVLCRKPGAAYRRGQYQHRCPIHVGAHILVAFIGCS